MKFSIEILYLLISGFVVELSLVEFSADIKTDGLEGVILFIKKNEKEPATIKSNLNGKRLPEAGLRWEIRKSPTLHYYGNNDGYCNQVVTNSELYTDLTATTDRLHSRGVYINEKIVVDYTNKSILGYSVVLRDGDYPIACATILPANQKHEDVIVHRARFNQMIGGEVYFIKVNTSTLAVGYVYAIDSNLFGLDLDWKLVYSHNSKVVGSENNEGYEKNHTCTSNDTSSCFVGELGAMSQNLIAKKADNGWTSMHHFRHVFPYLDVSALASKQLAIKLEPKLSNATLNILYPTFTLNQVEGLRFQPQFHNNGNGSSVPTSSVSVEFSQPTPYHTTVLVAKIDINSQYMHEKTKYPMFTIYNARPLNKDCKFAEERTMYTNGYAPYALLEETSYETLPPYKNFTDSTMHLEYPVFVSLFGSRSILESTLLINFGNSTSRAENSTTTEDIVCGQIKPLTNSGVIHLSAKFKNDTGLFGQFDFIQYILRTGKTDPVIWVNLNHETGNKTTGHMIHLHEYIPDQSNPDPHWRCSVTGNHFNPLAIQNDDEYKKLCSEATAYRCEIGDLSGKMGNYNIGYGEMKMVDPTLDLQGRLSPSGRSVIIHGPNGEKQYIGCEAIGLNQSQD